MAEVDFDRAIEAYHQALDEIVKGHPEPVLRLLSQREDVSLAHPFGPAVSGWEQVVQIVERAAANYQDGAAVQFETVAQVASSELGFIVEVERTRVRVGGRQDLDTVVLRVTTIFRLEDGCWKIVHRHADPTVFPLRGRNVGITISAF
jgi:ketosteroid isomerase-like protein